MFMSNDTNTQHTNTRCQSQSSTLGIAQWGNNIVGHILDMKLQRYVSDEEQIW